MKLLAIIDRLTYTPMSYAGNECPREIDILAYAEGKLSRKHRARLEAHLADCDDCREVIVFATRENVDARDADAPAVSEQEVKQQTARVLNYIERDEFKRRGLTSEAPKHRETVKSGWYVSYPQLASAAFIVFALAAGTVWVTRDQRPELAAMDALRLAMKDERRNQALVSGEIGYSPYSAKRGAEERDALNYERALTKLRFAEKETAPAEARHALARVLLAMGGRDEARRALAILDQLRATGVDSAELFNDLGVAELQLGHYSAAVAYFGRALEKSPSQSRLLFNKALAEQGAGQLEEAKQDWNRFISMTSEDQLKAEARSQLDLLR